MGTTSGNSRDDLSALYEESSQVEEPASAADSGAAPLQTPAAGSQGPSKAVELESPHANEVPVGNVSLASVSSAEYSIASATVQAHDDEKRDTKEQHEALARGPESSAATDSAVVEDDASEQRNADTKEDPSVHAAYEEDVSGNNLPISLGTSTSSMVAANEAQDNRLPTLKGTEDDVGLTAPAFEAAQGVSASHDTTANCSHPLSPGATVKLASSKGGGIPYAFSGVQTVVDASKVAVTALSFGRLDSQLLAFGSNDGCLRVADVSSLKSNILHEMQEHKERIADLAWSHQNDQLISVSEDGLVCVSSQDDGFWMLQRSMTTVTAALCCRFHPVNQNLILVGTSGSTVEVFNASTGLVADHCQAVLTSYGSEGVRATAMDISRNAVFVGDSSGYIHVLQLLLKKGQLQPLVLLGRVPPPGSQLEPLASLSFTSWSEAVKGPALLAAGTDDMVAIYKIISERGSRVWIEKGQSMPLTARMGSKVRLELSSKHLMPLSARPIRASWCPTLPSCEPEYIALGGENAAVNVWDVSDPSSAPVSVATLQGHASPVVAVAWSFDERRLASSDVDGTVIVWKREHAEMDH